MPLPPPPYPRILLLRGVGLWVGVRLMTCVLLLLRQPPGPPGPLDGAIAVVAVGAMALLDARRRGETTLLANLAVGPWPLAALPMAAALPLELALLAALP